MVICRGDGELVFHPVSGDVLWVGTGSCLNGWWQENGYKSVSRLEGGLGLDPKIMELPECLECPHYSDCSDELLVDEEPTNLYCTAIDEEATAAALMSALSALSVEECDEVL